ncbi:hypothetical protein [Streptomyces antimycoticus]|uniref:hypothetical protein n=1 Tax=Streptomyces antimycoticus TaxID=68175 RepID=UPI003867FC75|nr:hypothetical protein OG751_03920 [Streptomyces antimycoticus]
MTIVRPGASTEYDEYGVEVPGPAEEIPVLGCGVAPRDGNAASGNEQTQARDTVITGLTLYAPAGTDLRPTDKVRVADVLYEVDGQAGAFKSPFTGSGGPVVAALERVTG